MKPDHRKIGEHRRRTCHGGVVSAVRSMHLLGGRKLHQDGYEHEASAVSASHQERPTCQVPEADPHPDPARVSTPGELEEAEEDERGCAHVTQYGEGHYDLGYPDNKRYHQDGCGVSKGDGWEGLQDGAS